MFYTYQHLCFRSRLLDGKDSISQNNEAETILASGRSRKIKSTHYLDLQIHSTGQVSRLAADRPKSALREQFSESQVENCDRRVRIAGVNPTSKTDCYLCKHGNGATFTVAGKRQCHGRVALLS